MSQVIRWESHTCLPLHPDANFKPLDQLKSLGVHYVSINVGMDMNPLSQIMLTIAGFRARIAAHPEQYVLASSTADIMAAAKNNKLAIGFDLEGAMPLLERTEMVALYRDLGVKQIHFAYNRNNSVADGCHDTERGLTALGKQMVRAVNDAGLLMDCSHTGRLCSLDIMAASAKPVIFSHANPLALVEHGRNISDEQIKACAKTGGVVGISGISRFLGQHNPQALDVARHAAYIADLVGAQHVAIGLDNSFNQANINDRPPDEPNKPYDPTYWWPASAGYDRIEAPSTYVAITAWSTLAKELAAVGMNPAEIDGVMGMNMMRVAEATWS
jgi:membrane dipeptidase